MTRERSSYLTLESLLAKRKITPELMEKAGEIVREQTELLIKENEEARKRVARVNPRSGKIILIV